jgi:hypothetical protein
MRALMLVLAATAVAPVFAQQTYKWVDERGVVNYSNVPPSKRPAQAQPIENRVSVVPGDPNLAAAIAAMQAQGLRQAEFAHQEWLARQQGMLQAQALAALYPPLADHAPVHYGYGYGRYGYRYGYGVPVVPTRFVRSKPVQRTPHPAARRL